MLSLLEVVMFEKNPKGVFFFPFYNFEANKCLCNIHENQTAANWYEYARLYSFPISVSAFHYMQSTHYHIIRLQ